MICICHYANDETEKGEWKIRKAIRVTQTRNLGFHGYRKHFINKMLTQGVQGNVLAQVTGHTLAVMQNHYLTVVGNADIEKAFKK